MKTRVLVEPAHGFSYDQLLALALTTERSGFDAFFRSDHYLGAVPDDPAYRPTDSWTTLAGLARDTERVRLGTLVTAGTFRDPGVLAITAATVDQMSGGRVELGLGAGWYEREHLSFGLRFPSLRERFDRLEEQLAVVTGIWGASAEKPFDFSGQHYRVSGCVNPPQGAPPIIIGGAGPRRTPALAARFAAEFNGTFPDGLAERFAVVDRACEAVGRDPATLVRSVVLPVVCGRSAAEITRRTNAISSERLRAATVRGNPQQIIDSIADVRKIGATTVYFHLYDATDTDHIALLGADVLPHLPD